jgi:peptidoglycan/xylan/chitin deacetylase (PgdA/CDA1 family)
VLLVLNRFVYRGFGPQHAVFRHGNPSFRYIALTFDDGPDPKYTERILDILKANDVSATFFLVGDHVRSYPDLVRRMAADGHEIGNHTDTHRNLFLLPKRQTIAEIDNSAKSIAAVTAQRPRLFRPPRGLYDRALLSLLAERRNTLVLWSISSQDWAEVSPGGIRRNILSRVQGGDILLFHDSGAIVSAQGGDRDNTINALPKILSQLKARGFRLVTVSELYSITSLTGAR